MSYLLDVSGNAIIRNTLQVNGNISNSSIVTSTTSIVNPGVSGNVYVNNLNVHGVLNIFPPGTIMAFVTSGTPDGWFFCDGSYVSQSLYPGLSAIIGSRYGSATINGTPHFRLPDYRGAFLRGIGISSFVSPNYENYYYTGVDGSQNETILKHTHTISENYHGHYTTKDYANTWNNNSFLTGPYGTSKDFSGGSSNTPNFGVTTNVNYALRTGDSVFSNANDTIPSKTAGSLNDYTRPYCWAVRWFIKF